MRSINTHRVAAGRPGGRHRTTAAVAATLIVVATAPAGAMAGPAAPEEAGGHGQQYTSTFAGALSAEDGSGVRSFHPSQWTGSVDSNPDHTLVGGALGSGGTSGSELGIGAALLALGGLTLLAGLVAEGRRRRPLARTSRYRALAPEYPA